MTQMLSSKGKFCSKRVLIKGKFNDLIETLRGLTIRSKARVVKRTADSKAADTAWLEAEGQYAIDTKNELIAAENVADALKHTLQATTDMGQEQTRLDAMKISKEKSITEIEEEEAIIREILGYITTLENSKIEEGTVVEEKASPAVLASRIDAKLSVLTARGSPNAARLASLFRCAVH